MALPMSVLWHLRVTHSQKIGLSFLFAAGFIIIAFAVIRLTLTLPNKAHVNPKWLCIMSVTESSVAVIVGCAPALRVFFRRAAMRNGARGADRRADLDRSDPHDTGGMQPLRSGSGSNSGSNSGSRSVEDEKPIELAEMLQGKRGRVGRSHVLYGDASPPRPPLGSANARAEQQELASQYSHSNMREKHTFCLDSV